MPLRHPPDGGWTMRRVIENSKKKSGFVGHQAQCCSEVFASLAAQQFRRSFPDSEQPTSREDHPAHQGTKQHNSPCRLPPTEQQQKCSDGKAELSATTNCCLPDRLKECRQQNSDDRCIDPPECPTPRFTLAMSFFFIGSSDAPKSTVFAMN